MGQWLSRRFTRLRGKDYRARLVSAGMYTTTPERLLGTQFFVAVLAAFVWLWLGALAGASAPLLLLATIGAAVLGWVPPMFVVDSRARKRREQIERGFPT